MKPEYAWEKSEAAINTVYRGQLEIDEKLLNKPSDSFLQRFRAKQIILKPGEHGRGGIREQGNQPLFLLMGIKALVLAAYIPVRSATKVDPMVTSNSALFIIHPVPGALQNIS